MATIENFLLSIGAMKAGTSWLYMQLRSHPQIDAVPIKEIHYFAQYHTEYRLLSLSDRLRRVREMVSNLRADRPDEARAQLNWFRAYAADPMDDLWLASLFRNPRGPAWCAEFCNLNALLPPAGWAHVRRTCRRIRLLYTLRAPLTRLWSHARFELASTGRFDKLDHWKEAEFGALLTSSALVEHAHYAQVLSRLEQCFSPSEYRVLLYEDIKAKPRIVLADIEDFLGLIPSTYDDAPLQEQHNPGPVHAIPEAFVAAARPIVRAELAALEARGFAVPAEWQI